MPEPPTTPEVFTHPFLPCKWIYLFGITGDDNDKGCWTFDAWVDPSGPNCPRCEWTLEYCEDGAAGNEKGRDYMTLHANEHYMDGKMEGLCGNYDGITTNDDNDNDISIMPRP